MTAPDGPDPTTPAPAGPGPVTSVFDEHRDLIVLGGPVRVHTAGRNGTGPAGYDGFRRDTGKLYGDQHRRRGDPDGSGTGYSDV